MKESESKGQAGGRQVKVDRWTEEGIDGGKERREWRRERKKGHGPP